MVTLNVDMSNMAGPWIVDCEKFFFECVMEIRRAVADEDVWSLTRYLDTIIIYTTAEETN